MQIALKQKKKQLQTYDIKETPNYTDIKYFKRILSI